MGGEVYGWALDQRRKSKIAHLYVHLFVEQNVLALEITVNYSACVAVSNRGDNLPEHLLSFVFINISMFVNVFKKIPFWSIFHHHIEFVRVVDCVQQLDDVWMLDAAERLDFSRQELCTIPGAANCR